MNKHNIWVPNTPHNIMKAANCHRRQYKVIAFCTSYAIVLLNTNIPDKLDTVHTINTINKQYEIDGKYLAENNVNTKTMNPGLRTTLSNRNKQIREALGVDFGSKSNRQYDNNNCNQYGNQSNTFSNTNSNNGFNDFNNNYNGRNDNRNYFNRPS